MSFKEHLDEVVPFFWIAKGPSVSATATHCKKITLLSRNIIKKDNFFPFMFSFLKVLANPGRLQVRGISEISYNYLPTFDRNGFKSNLIIFESLSLIISIKECRSCTYMSCNCVWNDWHGMRIGLSCTAVICTGWVIQERIFWIDKTIAIRTLVVT